MRLLVVGAWSVALALSVLGLTGSGCDRAAANESAGCHDAAWWSGRSAEWPVDTFWIGDARVSFTDAMDRLELPARSGRDALQTALIVAELELAAHPELDTQDRLLPHVYAGHAYLAEAGPGATGESTRVDGPVEGSDRDAAELAEVLARATCGV